jgi:hypothetical protein
MAGRIKNAGTFMMLLPRELDPAAPDVPLPLPRPSPYSLSVDTMADPTALDSDEVPPEPDATPGPRRSGASAANAKSTRRH